MLVELYGTVLQRLKLLHYGYSSYRFSDVRYRTAAVSIVTVCVLLLPI